MRITLEQVQDDYGNPTKDQRVCVFARDGKSIEAIAEGSLGDLRIWLSENYPGEEI